MDRALLTVRCLGMHPCGRGSFYRRYSASSPTHAHSAPGYHLRGGTRPGLCVPLSERLPFSGSIPVARAFALRGSVRHSARAVSGIRSLALAIRLLLSHVLAMLWPPLGGPLFGFGTRLLGGRVGCRGASGVFVSCSCLFFSVCLDSAVWGPQGISPVSLARSAVWTTCGRPPSGARRPFQRFTRQTVTGPPD
jgi:hypothetical protein